MSAPFYGKKFMFIQPDGTKLPVRGWGDQYKARFETLDGFPIVENPTTGFYEYEAVSEDGEEARPSGIRAESEPPSNTRHTAGLSSSTPGRVRTHRNPKLSSGNTRWEKRRQRNKTAPQTTMLTPEIMLDLPPEKIVGDYVGLCLLIQFPDVPGTITREEVEAFCNQPGYTGFGNNGSVYDYFLENSLGKLRYTNLVAPYYTAKNKRDHYTDEAIAQGVQARELIVEALEHLQRQGFDFSPLSTDNEGYVYALNVFYAGPTANGWAKGLWPHASQLERPYALMTGKFAHDYQITSMGDELTIGTFCHENGHMLCNFPDLYDYGFESNGVGIYCLMSGGNLEPADKNPTQVCAYLKQAAGWAGSVTSIRDGLTMKAVAGKNQFFIYAKNRTEYFIIENRCREGRDEHLTSSGLAIWHVDHSGSNNHQERTRDLHYECALIQADGANDLEGKWFHNGDGRDLFHADGNAFFGNTGHPSSKWWDQMPSGLEIHSISRAGREMIFSTRIQSS